MAIQYRPVVDVNFGPDGKSLDLTVPTMGGQTARFDLALDLRWGQPDDSETLNRHAGMEAWWSARLADEIALQSEWVENIYDALMAHFRRFARYVLDGQRRRDPTKQDLQDAIFHLFSENAPEYQRLKFIQFAFLGFMVETLGNVGQVERLYQENRESYDNHYRTFHAQLTAYDERNAEEAIVARLTIEQVNRARIAGERSKALLEAAASGVKTRGFMLRQAAEVEQARRSMNPEKLVEDVAKKMHGDHQ